MEPRNRFHLSLFLSEELFHIGRNCCVPLARNLALYSGCTGDPWTTRHEIDTNDGMRQTDRCTIANDPDMPRAWPLWGARELGDVDRGWVYPCISCPKILTTDVPIACIQQHMEGKASPLRVRKTPATQVLHLGTWERRQYGVGHNFSWLRVWRQSLTNRIEKKNSTQYSPTHRYFVHIGLSGYIGIRIEG